MRNKLTNELAVCGYNAVAAVADIHPEKINRLFIREDIFSDFTQVCKQLAARKRPYKVCEDEELERICKTNHHQGIVAMIEEPVLASLEKEELDAWAAENETGILLNSVGNDLNLGAIIRSAAFFDCRYVILSGEDSEATLSTGAYRVAEGGMEHVEIRTVNRPAAFLKSAAQKLFVIGADHRARLRIRDLEGLIHDGSGKAAGKATVKAAGKATVKAADGDTGESYVGKPAAAKKAKAASRGRSGILLVVGNEEHGLPPNIKDQCPCLARIPGTGKIESLNVAQAATLFLHEIFGL